MEKKPAVKVQLYCRTPVWKGRVTGNDDPYADCGELSVECAECSGEAGCLKLRHAYAHRCDECQQFICESCWSEHEQKHKAA